MATTSQCPVCGGYLSSIWPNIDPESYSALDHHLTEWRAGAELGCALCQVVSAVAGDIERGGHYTLGASWTTQCEGDGLWPPGNTPPGLCVAILP
jgi:hypothetical protein